MIAIAATVIAISAILNTGNHHKSIKSLTHHNAALSYILPIAPAIRSANTRRANCFL